MTTRPGHAADLSRSFAADRFDVVMAWGGDGTINEVAGPLIGSRTALGVLPSGSGDGFAGSLGLPRNTADAFAAAVAGRVAPMDVGYMGDRHFLNTAGVGFDAAVAAAFNRSRRRGIAGYLTGIGRTLWRYEPRRYQLRLDTTTVEGRRMMIAFANGRDYGNRMCLAPHASAQDGWLDAVLVEDGPPWRLVWRARRLFLSPERPAHGIAHIRVRSASVTGEYLDCHVDGESFHAQGTLHVRIAPGAINVCGPPP